MNIGDRIKEFRTAKGYSVNYLANQAGVSQSYIREIELGHYENPTVDILSQICWALGISLKEFFDNDKEINNIEDSLLKEIASLSPTQRDALRKFLKTVTSGK